MKKLVAMLVVTCALLTACGRKEPVVAEIESSSTAVTEVPTVESRILTYEDIKDLPTYSGILAHSYYELYEKYSGNVSFLKKDGETSSTHYYVNGGECYTYLPDDTACLIQEEYDGYLTVIYKDIPNDKIQYEWWEISSNVFLPEDLEKLPEEPDWRNPSYIDVLTQHKGNAALILNPDIKKTLSSHPLRDASNKIICFVDSNDAIFRNGSTLVICSFHGNNTLYHLSYEILNPEEKAEYCCWADDSPIFCLAEDGLYYYIIEAGEKKVVKVADITNTDYQYSGMMNLENCVFPVFKKDSSPYKLVSYPLKNAIVTEEEPWFYTVDTVELTN